MSRGLERGEFRRWMVNGALFLFSFVIWGQGTYGAPVEIKGANGRVIAFDGIREAVPQGLWLRVTPGGEEVAVAWDKLDLEGLKEEHPEIYAAWESAQQGNSTLLELGSYERQLVNLNIAEAIENVSVHSGAAENQRAQSMNVLPYLYESGDGEHPLPFRFHAPEIEFREGDKKMPLVVWLHGAGSGGSDNSKNMNLNLASKLLEPSGPSQGNCFVMFPQYHDEYNWWTYTSDKRGFCRGIPGRQILDLVDKLVEQMPAVDGDRIYLMGMSQGGFGIPYLVTAYPNRFAAQVLIAGMTRTVPWTGDNVIPSWLFYSHDDPVMHQDGTDIGGEMKGILEGFAEEGAIKATTYDDAGHGGTLKRAIEEPELLPWLFEQSNESAPERKADLIEAHFN